MTVIRMVTAPPLICHVLPTENPISNLAHHSYCDFSPDLARLPLASPRLLSAISPSPPFLRWQTSWDLLASSTFMVSVPSCVSECLCICYLTSGLALDMEPTRLRWFVDKLTTT